MHNPDHGSRSPSHSPHSLSPTSHLGDNGMLPPITTASQQYHTMPPISSVGSMPGTESMVLCLNRLTYQLSFTDIPVTSSSCLMQPMSQCCYIDQVNITIHCSPVKPLEVFMGILVVILVNTHPLLTLYEFTYFIFPALDHQGNRDQPSTLSHHVSFPASEWSPDHCALWLHCSSHRDSVLHSRLSNLLWTQCLLGQAASPWIWEAVWTTRSTSDLLAI